MWVFLWRGGWWRNITDWVAVAWLVGVLDGCIVEYSRQGGCWMGFVCVCFLSIELFFGAGEETRKANHEKTWTCVVRQAILAVACSPDRDRCSSGRLSWDDRRQGKRGLKVLLVSTEQRTSPTIKPHKRHKRHKRNAKQCPPS